jgi:hypothetical protein
VVRPAAARRQATAVPPSAGDSFGKIRVFLRTWAWVPEDGRPANVVDEPGGSVEGEAAAQDPHG